MRIIFSLFLLCCLLTNGTAQQKSFEGVIDYQLEAKSKNPWISDVSIARLLAIASTMKVHIKQGNFRRESAKMLDINRTDSNRQLFMFKGIDTFYYNAPAVTEEEIPEISQSEKIVTIAGYNCKSLTIRSKNMITTYYYDPALFQDPAYSNPADKTSFTLFLKQTKAVYLKCVIETEQFVYTETAFRVAKTTVADAVFQLQSFPVAEFVFMSHLKLPVFKSGDEAEWVSYVQKSINADLVNKYVKIPKGEKAAQQTAEVLFVVLANGTVGEAEVINKKEIHAALAKEAVRIVKESFGWKPATVRGEKIDQLMMQKITFRIAEE
ncbi:hypothetical protein ESA94_18680 [Lacibacter luteus]|uniref:TonB C-terminal domain-containing protein n=1 Tax=Lacibacter luteus TaxID=2508719 RepID=A0A4Q1CE73_9BACT|nr:energy transducer TonB [Lacibacter luteus]RXK58040.1 hypothetical protein ESA94_18680 [Lacibacter luteus]